MQRADRNEATVTRKYLDCKRVAFADHAELYHLRRGLSGEVTGFIRSKAVRDAYAEDWPWCQVCGCGPDQGVWLETHHLIGGARRSDEPTNLLRLCQTANQDGCHSKANTDELPFSELLWHKRRTDRKHTDWVRLADLYGKPLPELVENRRLAAEYRRKTWT